MPTYDYLCQTCSHRFETWQKMTDEPLTICPECGSHIRRVLYPAGVVFKGSGFYKTDHSNNGTVASATNNDSKKAESPDSSTSSSTGENKTSSETSTNTGTTASNSNSSNTSSSESKSKTPATTKWDRVQGRSEWRSQCGLHSLLPFCLYPIFLGYWPFGSFIRYRVYT